MMYKTVCSNPNCKKGENGMPKTVYVFANDKLGSVNVSYCSSFCKKEDQWKERHQ